MKECHPKDLKAGSPYQCLSIRGRRRLTLRVMKTTSFLAFLIFFLSVPAIGAVKEAPELASFGIFAAFGAPSIRNSELVVSNEETHSIRFGFMTNDMAKNFGISRSQMESYNRDLDVLNAMVSEISQELGAMKAPTVDDAIGLWSGLKGAVSATTLEALQKITKGK
jgi:hypothetical protein